MSDFGRMLAKEMYGMGRIIVGNVFGNISPDIEWIKWLNYESEYEKKRIEYFDSKKVSELSYEELEEASRYSRNKVFAKLFKLYVTNKCSKEDYMRVYDYMSSESIEKLMVSKLTKEELKYAKEEITRLSKVSKEELSKKLKKEQQEEVYETLSMVDAYILHMISNIDYARSINKLNKEIDAAIERNEIMQQKSLYYAANSYVNK